MPDRSTLFHTHPAYHSLQCCHHKWHTELPSGGELPLDAQRFFSPYALWTRLPSIASVVLENAVEDYVRTYAEVVDNSYSNTEYPIDETFLSEYLEYRIVKDPAKRLLVGAFGEEWTEKVLREVMFPSIS